MCRLLVINTSSHGLSIARVPFAGENSNVGAAERGIAQGVAHGIDERIDVAQGVEKVPQLLRDAVARGQRFDEHQNVVRRPRDDEAEQNGRQRFGRLHFLALLLGFLFLFGRARFEDFRHDLGVER